MPRTVKHKQMQYFLLYHIPRAVYKKADPSKKEVCPIDSRSPSHQIL
ncbi:hypothetical protein MITSMUL_03955 [Mitsuokella multacida DSM 20544]|uniref:Uncharacterized protein n=1 Tax=Mitsuokella multacida DSM 20544 TaxID=500635 RepID=C9KL59_9FIRM|nr:hypothetical protein MITSMUL_03955 [Mitsuokella multacida DSM 20544]